MSVVSHYTLVTWISRLKKPNPKNESLFLAFLDSLLKSLDTMTLPGIVNKYPKLAHTLSTVLKYRHITSNLDICLRIARVLERIAAAECSKNCRDINNFWTLTQFKQLLHGISEYNVIHDCSVNDSELLNDVIVDILRNSPRVTHVQIVVHFFNSFDEIFIGEYSESLRMLSDLVSGLDYDNQRLIHGILFSKSLVTFSPPVACELQIEHFIESSPNYDSFEDLDDICFQCISTIPRSSKSSIPVFMNLLIDSLDVIQDVKTCFCLCRLLIITMQLNDFDLDEIMQYLCHIYPYEKMTSISLLATCDPFHLPEPEARSLLNLWLENVGTAHIPRPYPLLYNWAYYTLDHNWNSHPVSAFRSSVLGSTECQHRAAIGIAQSDKENISDLALFHRRRKQAYG